MLEGFEVDEHSPWSSHTPAAQNFDVFCEPVAASVAQRPP